MPSFMSNCLYFRDHIFTNNGTRVGRIFVVFREYNVWLTTNDVRNLAYQLAEKNKLPNSFNKAKRKARKDWLQGFMHRHKELCLRQPEATSAARIKSFNPQTINKFFDLFEAVMEKHKFPPQRIFNCDEIGITTVQIKATLQKF